MRASLDKLMRDNAHLAPETLVCPHIPYGRTHDEAAAGQWLEYARHPGILDLVSQLIGEDIILWGSQVFCKPPLTGKAIPWHQDGQFSLHDVYLIHGSNANRSTKRRAGFVVRYMPATSAFERVTGDEHVQSGVTFSMSKRPISRMVANET